MRVLLEQDESILQQVHSLHQPQGLVVRVVVLVTVVVGEVPPIHQGREESVQVEIPGDEHLRDVAATQTEIAEDVTRQGLQLFQRLRPVQHGHGRPLPTDDVRNLAEVMLEVAPTVPAAGGDDGIIPRQPFLGNGHLLTDPRTRLGPA